MLLMGPFQHSIFYDSINLFKPNVIFQYRKNKSYHLLLKHGPRPQTVLLKGAITPRNSPGQKEKVHAKSHQSNCQTKLFRRILMTGSPQLMGSVLPVTQQTRYGNTIEVCSISILTFCKLNI